MGKQYKRKDALYQKAKKEGYRSRAAYKLLELNDKYRLLGKGKNVVDLGAWPGGWTQVAHRAVSPGGMVAAVDLEEIEPFDSDDVVCLQGDLRDEATIAKIRELSPSGYDVVLSDMSAKLTGIRDADQAQALACLEICFQAAAELLKENGMLAAKTFPGNDIDQFIREMKPRFKKLNRIGLKSSRGSSKEFYVIGHQYQRESV